MEFFKKLFDKKESLLYFEAQRSPFFDNVCADPKCPNPYADIEEGSGYLYISKEVVDFRRNALTTKKLEKKLKIMEERMTKKMGFTAVSFINPGFPMLLCEKCARRKKLDLKISALDARYWWEKELVPLRETPLAGSKQAMQERERLKIKNNK